MGVAMILRDVGTRRVEVLSDSVEGGEGTCEGVGHRMWHLLVGRELFYVSWLACAADSGLPECMAFACDARGRVSDWSPRATSWSCDPNAAFSEVLDQLLSDAAA